MAKRLLAKSIRLFYSASVFTGFHLGAYLIDSGAIRRYLLTSSRSVLSGSAYPLLPIRFYLSDLSVLPISPAYHSLPSEALIYQGDPLSARSTRYQLLYWMPIRRWNFGISKQKLRLNPKIHTDHPHYIACPL